MTFNGWVVCWRLTAANGWSLFSLQNRLLGSKTTGQVWSVEALEFEVHTNPAAQRQYENAFLGTWPVLWKPPVTHAPRRRQILAMFRILLRASSDLTSTCLTHVHSFNFSLFVLLLNINLMGGAEGRWGDVKCYANVNDQILFLELLCCPPIPTRCCFFLCVCGDEIASEVWSPECFLRDEGSLNGGEKQHFTSRLQKTLFPFADLQFPPRRCLVNSQKLELRLLFWNWPFFKKRKKEHSYYTNFFNANIDPLVRVCARV